MGRRAFLAICGLGLAAALGPGCTEIDTSRQAPPRATLGDDIYGVLCDRLGASVISEDLVGASYHAICHYDEQGRYGDRVDAGVLPRVEGEAAVRARELSIAKMERMAAYRSRLVIEPAPTTGEPWSQRIQELFLATRERIVAQVDQACYDTVRALSARGKSGYHRAPVGDQRPRGRLDARHREHLRADAAPQDQGPGPLVRRLGRRDDCRPSPSRPARHPRIDDLSGYYG